MRVSARAQGGRQVVDDNSKSWGNANAIAKWNCLHDRTSDAALAKRFEVKAEDAWIFESKNIWFRKGDALSRLLLPDIVRVWQLFNYWR